MQLFMMCTKLMISISSCLEHLIVHGFYISSCIYFMYVSLLYIASFIIVNVVFKM